LATSGLILFLLCLGVFLSNPKKNNNQALSAFLASGFVWLLANFLTNISSSSSLALVFGRATLIGASLIPPAFLTFAYIFSKNCLPPLRQVVIFSILPLSLIILTPTAWNISHIEAYGKGAVTGPVYYLLIPTLIIYFALGIYFLIRKYRRSFGLEKTQLQYIFAGLILTLIPGLIINGILPAIGYSDPSAYGPIAVVIMSIFTTAAIVKHKLLDIRLVVARSIAYILVLVTLATTYSVIVFGILDSFFNANITDNIFYLVLNVVFALFLAFSFQPIKRFFDRVSNRLFFRDYYEPQEVLDQLSNLLVRSVETPEIKQGSADILKGAVKPVFVGYLLVYNQSLKNLEGQVLLNLLVAEKKEVIVTDELEADKMTLQKALLKEGVSVAVSLRTKTAHLGFLLLGHKLSGSIYSDIDKKMLSIAADGIAISLQNALRFEEIQRFNITLQQRIEEATRELQKANTRLKELDKSKDEFISMASHQLRTPLTAIKGYLSMVLEGDVGPVTEQEKTMIKRAYDGAQKMVYLIADLLNISRLQSGRLIIENKPTDLSGLVEGEIAQLQESAAHHKIKLIYQKPSSFPTLMLDENKIRQVVMNFLDNALHYTSDGGTVTAALVVTDENVNFTVTDTGVGVPKEVQPHLFAKFYRADNARKIRPDGTGLGLFMAKKVIDAQGGTILFQSEEGKGSTFGFRFPLKQVRDSVLNPSA